MSFTSGETQWLPLRTVKESNPVELAEYAINNLIEKEPAFAWWVPYTLNKLDRIIKKVKAKYWHTMHKFGVRIPKSLEEAIRIDKENGNTLWQDAIEKEMRKAKYHIRLSTDIPQRMYELINVTPYGGTRR